MLRWRRVRRKKVAHDVETSFQDSKIFLPKSIFLLVSTEQVLLVSFKCNHFLEEEAKDEKEDEIITKASNQLPLDPKAPARRYLLLPITT